MNENCYWAFKLIPLCGLINTKMSTEDVIEELMQICIDFSSDLYDFGDHSEKCKEYIIEHIKRFEKVGPIDDFEKDLEWFNVSESLSLKQHLKGKIVLLDFFTYCCINCMHVLAELEKIEKTLSIEDGFVVVGIHSAKFTNERDPKNILSAVQRYNILHPVVNDSSLKMWKDMGILCWPSLIILGPSGQPLFAFSGEHHESEILSCVKVALEYFKSSNQISSHSLPLKPAHHLLPSPTDGLLFPGKLAILLSENRTKLVISDSGNNRIVITSEAGEVEHVIGGYNRGFKDSDFKSARFDSPQGVCVHNDIIYVADKNNHAIRKVDMTEKIVSTIAGDIQRCDTSEQFLSSPWDVAIYDYEYNDTIVPVLLIAIAGTHQIWAFFFEDTIWWKKEKFTAGTCTPIIGSGKEENRNNFYPHAVGLAQPSGLVVVSKYKLAFCADSESSTIRQLHLENGQVSPVCGGDINPMNLHAFGDVDGAEFSAKLQHPLGVAWDYRNKRIYIADTYNHKIKTVDTLTRYCKTLFGDGKPDNTFSFNEPAGLVVGPDGNTLYVADTNNHTVKVIDLKNQKISTLAISFRRDSDRNIDGSYTFDTAVNTRGGELSISFNVIFSSNDLKLNEDTPQKWHVSLPVDTWTVDSSTGRLSTPVSIKLPKDEESNQLHITLNIIACTKDMCIPLKLSVVFNVHRKTDAPTVVVEEKELVVDKKL